MGYNELNASWFIDQLIQQGVCHFCIAPGSRSTPLALAIADHPRASYTVHFDERGLGFFALGYAQGNRRPVAIVVTSGPAVANLLPAVMESCHSAVPLILLTSDHPPEARDNSSNQTSNQIKAFSNWIQWEFDFPPPSAEIEEKFIRSQVAQAVFRARKGPVQLNCMFRKPLWEKSADPYPIGQPIEYTYPYETLAPADIEMWSQRLSGKRGLILIGRMQNREEIPAIFELAHKLRWPICADVLSQARTLNPPAELMRHPHHLIPPSPPEIVLRFGEVFVTSSVCKDSAGFVVHISPQERLCDPDHRQQARVKLSARSFCQALSPMPSENSWLKQWHQLDLAVGQKVETLFQSFLAHTESSAMRLISATIPAGWSYFLGTSMPVREADLFLYPNQPIQFYSNRGVSGIDGTLATAIGIAKGSGSPLVAIIGDQACLHDLSSFALLPTLITPFILILSNNFGGGIFSYLPIFGKTPHFEALLGAAHVWRFSSAAQMFGIPYEQTEDWSGSLQRAIARGGPTILEWTTSRAKNLEFHQNLHPATRHLHSTGR